jgi:hypothetical protein
VQFLKNAQLLQERIMSSPSDMLLTIRLMFLPEDSMVFTSELLKIRTIGIRRLFANYQHKKYGGTCASDNEERRALTLPYPKELQQRSLHRSWNFSCNRYRSSKTSPSKTFSTVLWGSILSIYHWPSLVLTLFSLAFCESSTDLVSTMRSSYGFSS